jgi:glycosyltransferase involved in cell wall biosynthesis
MKIGHINLAAGFRGGERQTGLLIRALAEKGWQQVLIVRKGSALTRRLADIPGLEIREIGKPFMLHTAACRDCDLLHAHEAKAAQYAYLCKLRQGVPYIITRRVPKIPKNTFFTRAVYRNASKITALSAAIRHNLHSFNSTLDIVQIPSMASALPVNESTVHALREKYAGKFVIGHIGALVNYHKGQQFLLEAAKDLQDKLDNSMYLFLGEGKDEAWFREIATGVDNIEFVGFVDNVGDYIEIFDLFAFPSLQEGLGSILLDVMRAGKPIIASDVDGIPDLIRHDENGLLVPPGESNALAQAMQQLYHDDAMRERLGEQAKVDSGNYVPEMIAQRFIEQIYSQIPAE